MKTTAVSVFIALVIALELLIALAVIWFAPDGLRDMLILAT